MSRHRPRRSRSLVEKMRGQFERHRRSHSLTARESPDAPVNVFASDMVSNAFILNRFKQVGANYKLVRLEIEDLIVNVNREVILPCVKNLLVDNRRWKSVSFVDSVRLDQFDWWVHLKLRVMADFAALASIDTALDVEVFAFQGCVHVCQGTTLECFFELLISIRGSNDVNDVTFAGALFGYGEATIGVALAEALDQGKLLETITVNVRSGWKKNLHWSNMLDACIRAVLDLKLQFAEADNSGNFSASCSDISSRFPLDFPLVAQNHGHLEDALSAQPSGPMGFAEFGAPRRSRSTTGLPGSGRRSSVLSDAHFERRYKSGGVPLRKSAAPGSIVIRNEEPGFSWELEAWETWAENRSNSRSQEIPAYCWEEGSYAHEQAGAFSTPGSALELKGMHSGKGEPSRTGNKSKYSESSSSDAVNLSVKRRPPPRCHSASGTTITATATSADLPQQTQRPPRRSKSKDSAYPAFPSKRCELASRSKSNDFGSALSLSLRQNYRRMDSGDHHGSFGNQRKQSKSCHIHDRLLGEVGYKSTDCDRTGHSSRHVPRRSKSNGCHPSSPDDCRNTRRSPIAIKSNAFCYPLRPNAMREARQAPRRSKSIDFQHPSLGQEVKGKARQAPKRSKSIDFVHPSLVEAEKIPTRVRSCSKSNDFVMPGHWGAAKPKSAMIRSMHVDQIGNNPIQSRRGRTRRSKSTLLPKTSPVLCCHWGADKGKEPDFDWTSQSPRSTPSDCGEQARGTKSRKQHRSKPAGSTALKTMQCTSNVTLESREELSRCEQDGLQSQQWCNNNLTSALFDWSSQGSLMKTRGSGKADETAGKTAAEHRKPDARPLSGGACFFNWSAQAKVTQRASESLFSRQDEDVTARVSAATRPGGDNKQQFDTRGSIMPDFNWAQGHRTNLAVTRAEERKTAENVTLIHSWASRAIGGAQEAMIMGATGRACSSTNFATAREATARKPSSRRPKLTRSKSEASTLCSRTESPTSVFVGECGHDFSSKRVIREPAKEVSTSTVKVNVPDYNWVATSSHSVLNRNHLASEGQSATLSGFGSEDHEGSACYVWANHSQLDRRARYTDSHACEGSVAELGDGGGVQFCCSPR